MAKAKTLQEKAMLVSIKVSMYTGRTKDKGVGDEVIKAKKAKPGAGAWWTYQLSKHDTHKINVAEDHLRGVWRKYTLPWNDQGTRILPVSMMDDFLKEWRDEVHNFEAALDEFCEIIYPAALARAKDRLGDLEVNMPSVKEIRDRFHVSRYMCPMPNVADFRVKINNEDIDDIKAQFESATRDMLHNGLTALWEKLAKLVGKMVDMTDSPKNRVYESTLSNLIEFCETIPKLNFMDDPTVNEMAKEVLTKLQNVKTTDIRESKADRKKVNKEVKAVLKKISDYC